MVSGQTKKVIFSLIVGIGLSLAHAATAHIRFPFAPLVADESKPAKNLILILDVKQQEHYLGACGYTLAVALKDETAPIIASAHALSFVESYIKPEQWDIYKQDNLLLFIPKAYLEHNKLSEPKDAGFVIDGWHKVPYAPMKGSTLYASFAKTLSIKRTFNDLSAASTKIIANTLSKDKNCRWKVYAVGHGAPDAHQVCGLNLKDFRSLLDFLEQDIETDFLVYQTCFGGGPDQLKKVYADQQGIFKKFNFPIISGALTNSVSFGFQPESGVTFKPLFTQIKTSHIMKNKMRRLLKAVNKINKGLDMAREYHWSNNLLLIRMPNSEVFEPVADNKSVFKLSELSTLDTKSKEHCADTKLFKCMLINKPILDITLDLTQVNNFMIASGISRDTHYIQEMHLAPAKTTSSSREFVSLFNSLGMTEKDKIFFIDTITMGNTTYSHVKITQIATGDYSGETTLQYFAHTDDHVETGTLFFNKTRCVDARIDTLKFTQAQQYLDTYDQAVRAHRNKRHEVPFGRTPLSIPFRIIDGLARAITAPLT